MKRGKTDTCQLQLKSKQKTKMWGVSRQGEYVQIVLNQKFCNHKSAVNHNTGWSKNISAC